MVQNIPEILDRLFDAFWFVLPLLALAGIVVQALRIRHERDAQFPEESQSQPVHQENGQGSAGIDLYNLSSVRFAIYRDRFVFSAYHNRFQVPFPAITSIRVTEGLLRRGIKIRFMAGADTTIVFVPKDLDILIARFEDVGVRIADKNGTLDVQ